MPQTCKACKHPKRTEIDVALAAGESLRNIASRYGMSDAALCRHKAHASASLVRASERREESIGASVLRQLQSLCQRTERILSRAERKGADRTFILAARELRESLGAVYKVTLDSTATNPPHNPSSCPFCSSEQYQQVMISSVRNALGVGQPTQPRIEAHPIDEPPVFDVWGGHKTITGGDGTRVDFQPVEAQPPKEPETQPEDAKPTNVFHGPSFIPGEDWRRR